MPSDSLSGGQARQLYSQLQQQSDPFLRLGVPSTHKGLLEGVDPASVEFPEAYCADIENLRVVGSLWQTRLGMTLWKATGGAGAGQFLANYYKSDGTVVRLAMRGGSLYQSTGGGAFALATGGAVFHATNIAQGTFLRDTLFITDRSGVLRRYDNTNGVQGVTQPTGPSAAPTVKRRVYGILERWAGSVGATPTGWTIDDSTNFKVEVADNTSTGTDPDFPQVENANGTPATAKFTFSTSKKNINVHLTTTNVALPLNSNSIAFFAEQDSKRAVSVLEIGSSGYGDLGSSPIDPPETSQLFAWFMDIGFQPSISYLRFRKTKAPTSTRHLYTSRIYLPGKLFGKFRWRFSHVQPSTGAESVPSPATEFQDFSAAQVSYVTVDAAAFQKAASVYCTHDSDSTTTQMKVYRNGGDAPALFTGEFGQDVWIPVATIIDLSTTFLATSAAGDGTIRLTAVTAGSGSDLQTLAAGGALCLEPGTANEEFVLVYTNPADGTNHYPYTDLVIDGATNTKVTSATRAFVAGDVGNSLTITSGTGFTVQTVTINSVASGAATCSASLGTLGSTGGVGYLPSVNTGSGKGVILQSPAIFGHTSSTAIQSAFVDNVGNETAAAIIDRQQPERNDPPSGAQWLATSPDERLWIFGTATSPLTVYVSNRPTVTRPSDHFVFPQGVDPLTRGDLLQGWNFNVGPVTGGDKIMWGGFYQGVPTILTSRALYQVHAYSQAEWGPTAVSKVLDVGCVAGETVCEVNGLLYWAGPGPVVYRWDGRGEPDEVSFKKVTTTLKNAPSAYWSQWFARPHWDENGQWYKLWLTPSGATTNTQLLEYNATADVWERHTYYDSGGTAIPWAYSLVWNGPGDKSELYAQHPTSGDVFQLETGSTDNSQVIRVRLTTRKFPVCGVPGLVGVMHWLWLRLIGVSDTLTVRVRCGGSQYRNAAAYAATDGDPYADYALALSNTSTADLQVQKRIDFTTLKGDWVQFRVTGNVSNRPGLRELEWWSVPSRYGSTNSPP